jgi:hypothetical protein
MNQIIEAKGSLVVTKTLISQAEDLAAEHEEFNTNYVIGGRKALYNLLGKIAVLVERFDAALDKAELIKIVRKNLQEQYGIKTQENTSDVTILVRYITRADRKTAHVYARAIETARANQIAPAQFSGYLEQAGGVERIRANGVECEDGNQSKSSQLEKLEIMRKYLNARRDFPLASIKFSGKQGLQADRSGDLNVLVCSSLNGRYYVLAKLVPDAALERNVLEGLAQKLPDNLKLARKDVERFYTKAMKKRSSTSLKLMIKRRPEVAESMLRAKRFRSLALVKSSSQSL